MSGVFDKVRAENPKPKVPSEGYIWLTMLIKYNYKTGKSEIVRSFSKPAKDSAIKKVTKPKKKIPSNAIELKKSDTTTNEEVELF